MQRKPIALGHTVADPVTQQEALAAVDALIAARQGGFVVTPNVDHIVLAESDHEFRHAYRRARLSLADGQPLIWMARALGTPLPEKISGSDFIEPLMAYAAANGKRVFLFGATPDVSAEAESRLRARYPRLSIVGRDTSHWSPSEPAASIGAPVVGAIRRSRADLVIVALGSPKQELWMARHERDIAPAIAFGLGGSLDFVAGAVSRAPAWMSRAGLEWTYRLAQEPRRMAYRYLVRDMRILSIFATALWRRAIGRTSVGVPAGSEAGL